MIVTFSRLIRSQVRLVPMTILNRDTSVAQLVAELDVKTVTNNRYAI